MLAIAEKLTDQRFEIDIYEIIASIFCKIGITRRYDYDDVAHWGQLNWALPLLNIVLDSQSESVAYQLQNLMFTNNVPEGKYRDYYRFQAPLSSEDGRDQMDNASSENIQELEELGDRLIRESKKSLDELCSVLED